ncbi:MAG: RidA family protein, partial [Alphaproteobacteria bacterium]|nr:RidA family protein [Alphaproteobacteria bacterium]
MSSTTVSRPSPGSVSRKPASPSAAPTSAAPALEGSSKVTENTEERPRRQYIKRQTAQARAYSQAVITEGGRIVWLAGQVGAADDFGNSLAGYFDGQVREVFARLSQTLRDAGGSLADMVTMTVFIT